MSDSLILELKKHKEDLKQVESMIEVQNEMLDTEPDSFAYKLSMKSLQSHRESILNSIKELEEVYNVVWLDVKLDSPDISAGTVPIDVIVNALSGLQDMVYSIAQAIHRGVSERGRIPADILSECRLHLTNVYAGSFGMNIEGSSSTNILGENLLKEAVARLGNVLEAGSETETLMEQITDLGSRTVQKYKVWLGRLEKSSINLSVKWKDKDKQSRTWNKSCQDIGQIRKSLENIRKEAPVTIDMRGTLMGASLLTDNIDFIDSQTNERISGKALVDIRPMLTEYFGKECIATFKKETYHNNYTGRTKYVWTLMKLAENIKY
jgi:hypothetical protein